MTQPVIELPDTINYKTHIIYIRRKILKNVTFYPHDTTFLET